MLTLQQIVPESCWSKEKEEKKIHPSEEGRMFILGIAYFHCAPQHGIFAPSYKVELLQQLPVSSRQEEVSTFLLILKFLIKKF